MFSPVNNVYCMGVYSDPTTVIGNNILQNHHAVFDLENRRFGIASANISFKVIALHDLYIKKIRMI